MRIRISKSTVKGILMPLVLVLLTILASKTVLFGILYAQETILATIAILFCYMCYLNQGLSFSKKTIEFFCLFVIILVFASSFYIKDIMSETRSYLGALIHFIEILVIGLFIVNVLDKYDFIKCYVWVMFTIACISLPFFAWNAISRSSALGLSSMYQSGNAVFLALPWYTFGQQHVMSNGYVYSYIYGRNAGPFWEPGAFQGFLWVGLFLVLSYKQLFPKKKILVIIYLLTILTTQSTTGYLILLASLLAFGSDYIECIFGVRSFRNRRIKLTAILITTLFVIAMMIVVLRTENISNKFDVDNGSFKHRMTDIKDALPVLLYNPFAGVGLGSTGILIANAQTASATTLIYLGEYLGLPFMLYYAYRFFAGCISLYAPTTLLKKIVLISCFFMILMSETLHLLPLYAVFLFCTKKWKGNTLTA